MVVLGGRLAADVLEEDARRYFSVYGTYGISVYATRGVSVEDLAQRPPLVRFAVLTIVRAGVLRSSGFSWSRRVPIPSTSRSLGTTSPEVSNQVRPGAMLCAGNQQAQAVVRVVAVDDDGQVHFSILPGSVAKNRHLLGRTVG